MNAGALDERITIEQPGSTAPDAGGSFTITFTPLATVWAKIEAQGGSESAGGLGKVEALQQYSIEIRWRAGLSTRHRMQWRGKMLEITSIDESRRREGFMTIAATERRD